MEDSAMCIQKLIKEEVEFEYVDCKIEVVEEELRMDDNLITEYEKSNAANELGHTSTSRAVGYSKKPKKRILCSFCKLEVTNFQRHVEVKHRDCKAVKDMLSFPKHSKERKDILALIRSSGHILAGSIRHQNSSKENSNVKSYRCSHCNSSYSKKYLRRHSKICIVRAANQDMQKFEHLSAWQTLIASASRPTTTLQKSPVPEEVFDTVNANDISVVASSDPLIRHFKANFSKELCSNFKGSTSNSLVAECSNEIQELAMLLIELRHCTQNRKYELVNAFHPDMFKKVVQCAKKIGGYDPNTNKYSTPVILARIGTSLKQASDLLVRLIVKPDGTINFDNPEEKIKDVIHFRDLIEGQWTTATSCKQFSIQIKNKMGVLPLTKDILKFKEFVTCTANKAVAALREDEQNRREFKNLVDAALVLTILYNTKRTEDVQSITIDTYLQNFPSAYQNECMNMLTTSEKFLTRRCKYVVTKRELRKATIFFFPQNIQEFIDVIIKLRNSTHIVPDSNPYLFGYPNINTWARGDIAIRKFTQMADLEYPKEIVSNKLLKQITKVMQILNLNKQDSQHFTQFMGYTGTKEHEFCKLPPDIYETAKISKLLLLMDKGQSSDKYKGKTLQEIDIDPELEFAEFDEEEEWNEENTKSGSQHPYAARSKKAERKSGWTGDQREVIIKYFKDHIKNKKSPRKHECEYLLQEYPQLFANKCWVKLKAYVYNVYRER